MLFIFIPLGLNANDKEITDKYFSSPLNQKLEVEKLVLTGKLKTPKQKRRSFNKVFEPAICFLAEL